MAGQTEQETCPELNLVEALFDQRLDPASRSRLEAHLPTCPQCQGELEALAQIRGVLRDPAALAAPPLDRTALAAALFDEDKLRPSRWAWGAALGSLAAAAAALLVSLWFWPGAGNSPGSAPRVEAPIRPSAVEPLPVDLQRHQPAEVIFASGRVRGTEDLAGAQRVSDGSTLVTEDESMLALRLDAHCRVAILPQSQVRLEHPQGWALRLDRGQLAVRLAPGRLRPFSVQTSEGLIEALGTAFAIEKRSDGATGITLLEGRLRVTTRQGARHQLEAPVRALLDSETLRAPLALADVDRQSVLLLDELVPSESGSQGLVRLTSEPRAEVRSADRILGRTPLYAQRTVGPWTLELSAPRHVPRRIELRVQAHAPVAMHVKLPPMIEAAPAPLPPRAIDPDALLARVRRQVAARQLTEAQAALNAYLKDHPDDLRARFLLADAMRLDGQAPAALDAYGWVAAHSADPRQQEAAIYQQGLLQLQSLDSPKEALGTFQRLRRQQPHGLLRQEVAFHLAACYLALADYPRSLRALRDYLRLYPRGTRADEAQRLVRELEEKGWH